MRPAEFAEMVSRPFVYYRMYSGRASRYFEDFKIIGTAALVLSGFIFISFVNGEVSLSGNPHILLWITGIFIFNFIAGKIFSRWQKNIDQIHFIKWIYAMHASFVMSFLFFLIAFVNIDFRIKQGLLILILILFYIKYLRVLYKLYPEWHIKAFHIILYLCVSEIIPVSVLILSLRHHL
jgi:hypothetical protein